MTRESLRKVTTAPAHVGCHRSALSWECVHDHVEKCGIYRTRKYPYHSITSIHQGTSLHHLLPHHPQPQISPSKPPPTTTMPPPTFSTPYVSALRTFYNKMSPQYNAVTSTMHAGGPERLIAAIRPFLPPPSPSSSTSPPISILDLATGTGKVALLAAKTLGPTAHILGLDISDAFLSIAADSAREQGVSSQVAFLQRDVAHLDLPATYAPRWADAVTCGSAWAMFPEQKTVLDTLASSVLKPGGVFVADMWGPLVPAQVFLQVAVPRGFRCSFDPVWILDTERAFRALFEGVPGYELVRVEVEGRSEVRFDVGDEEKVEKLWRNMAEEQTWLSFGLETLEEGVREEIRRVWGEEVRRVRDEEGVVRGEMKQWIAVARVRE